MISTFNLTKLHGLLEDFYRLTQIRIVVFDENLNELEAYPADVAPFCQILRATERGEQECRECDARSCAYATKHHSTYTYRCYAGLTECITPLYMGNLLIGYLLFGHVFDYPTHQEGWENIQLLTKDLQVDQMALKKACWERPITSPEYIQSATHILSAVGTYLCMERMVSLHTAELPVEIDQFVQEHFTDNLTAKDICHHFGIGRTQLYEISCQNYGCGIADHIRRIRIDYAKQLLEEQPDMTIAEVADACGYEDYNYFITVFRREVGVPPRKYRTQQK